ncbi:hypothetical protein N1030_01555 [Desulfovibrio mangrovi]|uniref:hypothetical protein n=1 Tax=Desulfovibrio mangrovi TaxID=2976983 RepID=UPI0022458DFA|nr:hypothetical protein [Desulfovibrio mangrovi]UZP67680.1 hypothetical protein N1030_01555 [Desulfovibrio mangrovi]
MASEPSIIDWKVPLTEAEKAFIESCVQGLPPIIAREKVEVFTGGWFNGKTLANADSKGRGPRGALKSGQKVLYRTRDLIEWGVRRFGVREFEQLPGFGRVA